MFTCAVGCGSGVLLVSINDVAPSCLLQIHTTTGCIVVVQEVIAWCVMSFVSDNLQTLLWKDSNDSAGAFLDGLGNLDFIFS